MIAQDMKKGRARSKRARFRPSELAMGLAGKAPTIAPIAKRDDTHDDSSLVKGSHESRASSLKRTGEVQANAVPTPIERKQAVGKEIFFLQISV